MTCKLMQGGRMVDEEDDSTLPAHGQNFQVHQRGLRRDYGFQHGRTSKARYTAAAPEGMMFTGVALEMDFNNRDLHHPSGGPGPVTVPSGPKPKRGNRTSGCPFFFTKTMEATASLPPDGMRWFPNRRTGAAVSLPPNSRPTIPRDGSGRPPNGGLQIPPPIPHPTRK